MTAFQKTLSSLLTFVLLFLCFQMKGQQLHFDLVKDIIKTPGGGQQSLWIISKYLFKDKLYLNEQVSKKIFLVDPVNGDTTNIAFGRYDDPQFTSSGDLLYFVCRPDSAVEQSVLFCTDGTHAGTKKIAHPKDGSGVLWPHHLTSVGNKLYCSAQSTLFVTDGSHCTIIDSADNKAIIDPMNFLEFNGSTYFTAGDYMSELQLWKTDGTIGGTKIIVKWALKNSYETQLSVVNGRLLLNVNNDLCSSDGTIGNLEILKKSAFEAFAFQPALTNNKLVYLSSETLNGKSIFQIMVTDATVAGSKTLLEVPDGFMPRWLKRVNNRAIFYTSDGQTGYNYYISDGTTEGTVLMGADKSISGDYDNFVGYAKGRYYWSNNANEPYLFVSNGKAGVFTPVYYEKPEADTRSIFDLFRF